MCTNPESKKSAGVESQRRPIFRHPGRQHPTSARTSTRLRGTGPRGHGTGRQDRGPQQRRCTDRHAQDKRPRVGQAQKSQPEHLRRLTFVPRSCREDRCEAGQRSVHHGRGVLLTDTGQWIHHPRYHLSIRTSIDRGEEIKTQEPTFSGFLQDLQPLGRLDGDHGHASSIAQMSDSGRGGQPGT